MPNGIGLCPWPDEPVPAENGSSSDMSGPGETLPVGSPGGISLGAFDQAVTPKSDGGSPTAGRMKTSQFANTPDHGSPMIQTSEATNLTGKAKAK